MWALTRLLAIITRVFVIIITLLLCIVTLHVAASADGGPGTDWLTVSVSAAADPDLASRYSRAEVTEVTRIYKEDNTNTATARPLAHTAATSAWNEGYPNVPEDFTITVKAPTRAFSWLKAATTAFTLKTLLRHYAEWALTPRKVDVLIVS